MTNDRNLVKRVNRVAIIVLGCRPYNDDGAVRQELKARVGKGVELYQRGFGGVLIFTGGSVFSQVPESAVMKSLASMIPKEDIVLELHARSTEQNALLTKRILLRMCIVELILVTSPYHLPRALKLFEKRLGPSFIVRGVGSEYSVPWPKSLWVACIEQAKWWRVAPEQWLQQLGNSKGA